MKLLISAAFGQLIAGQSTVPIPLPTQLSSLGDFLGGAGASIFGATDMSKVVNHGCHCKKFGNWDSPNQGGQPVDALDAICKQFWERRSCIKLSGGTCTSYHTSGGSYPEPQYIATAYLVNGAPVISPDVNFHCQAVTNPCSRDICEIDHATILQIVGGGHGTASHNWDFTNQCDGGRGIPNVDLPDFTCVGSGADATWAYRADIPTQLEHANDFFQQTAALKFFGDVAFTKIMDHGCHCKKLGDHDAEIQGGSTTVDDLDKRCKDFFMKRQCLKSNTGFSGSCSGGYPADSYQGALRVTDVERVSNGDQFPGMFEWFSDRQQHCSNLEEGSCLYDICNVDHDSIY